MGDSALLTESGPLLGVAGAQVGDVATALGIDLRGDADPFDGISNIGPSAWRLKETVSLRTPYRSGDFDKSMYADFIMLHQSDDGIVLSINDPHGFHLADAVPKLKGLAAYAEGHGDVFARIDAVVETKKNLMALDLKSETVRTAVDKVTEDTPEEFYLKHGGDYS